MMWFPKNSCNECSQFDYQMVQININLLSFSQEKRRCIMIILKAESYAAIIKVLFGPFLYVIFYFFLYLSYFICNKVTNREKEKYMIFTKIGIENYRAIDHLEYEPQNRIACLSGSNGRGKSSFFSALYTGIIIETAGVPAFSPFTGPSSFCVCTLLFYLRKCFF